MSRAFTLVQSAAVSALIIPTTLWADITADDVWQNILDYSAVFGGALTADMSRSGDTVSVSDMTYTMDLPLEAGTVTVNLGSAELKERGDGAVDWFNSDTLIYRIAYSGSEEIESFSFDIPLTYEGMTMQASGEPNDITYDWKADRLDMAIGRIPLGDEIELSSLNGGYRDMVGQFRVTVGDLVDLQGNFEVGEQFFDMKQSLTEFDGSTVKTFDKSRMALMTGNAKGSFPRNGINILNLTTALRDGLSFETSQTVEGYDTQQIVESDGTAIMTQVTQADSYGLDLALNESGFSLAGPSKNIRFELEMMDPMPQSINASINSADVTFVMPLLKNDGNAPVAMLLDMQGITLGEAMWALFDPEQMLDRSPADVTLDLSGTAKNNVEWLDFLNIEAALAGLDVLPVEMQELTLNALRISAAGAEVTGTGALTFDNTDLTTFDGMPRPEGSLEFDLLGINGLMDSLVLMGLLPEQDIVGFRMIMAMVTAPAESGEKDHLTSTIEMTPEGHVLANGNRLK